METTLDYLREYIELGFSIVPIRANTKEPQIIWKPYQKIRPTFEQLQIWHKKFPNCNWAIITGEISGVTVVDTDSPAALQAAEALGLTNGCCVKTNNGHHFYFNYVDDGKERLTNSGVGSKGTYWPQIEGLDLRNNGGYALLPPSKGYEWQIDEADIMDEMTPYEDWPGATFKDDPVPLNPLPLNSKFKNIDLTNITAEGAIKTKNSTREKFKEIAKQYPSGKIPRGGSGIHDATYNFLAEEVLFVGMGPELEAAGQEFMADYFETPLIDGRFETSLNTIKEKERTNHPERFNENGVYQHHLNKKGAPKLNTIKVPPIISGQETKFMTARNTVQYAGNKPEFWQSPWLPKNAIIQVYGYSGHGKSLFLQHALHHLATGLHFGPFDHCGKKPKILYLDFENGKATLGRRNEAMLNSFGDTKDNLLYWTPWKNNEQVNLRDNEGIITLLKFLNQVQPDIVVIDTLRSAYPGLKENSAEDWSGINQLAIKIRNAGCSVILVHHSNKPDKEGLGREAGSSNQLTVLETQVRVTQVYNDADMAKNRGGIYAGDLPSNPFIYMQKQTRGATLDMVMEVSYGKVREWTDLHDPKQYIGIARRQDGRSHICYSDSPKQRLKYLIRKANQTRDLIVGKMQRPVPVLEEWCEEMGLKLPK